MRFPCHLPGATLAHAFFPCVLSRLGRMFNVAHGVQCLRKPVLGTIKASHRCPLAMLLCRQGFYALGSSPALLLVKMSAPSRFGNVLNRMRPATEETSDAERIPSLDSLSKTSRNA